MGEEKIETMKKEINRRLKGKEIDKIETSSVIPVIKIICEKLDELVNAANERKKEIAEMKKEIAEMETFLGHLDSRTSGHPPLSTVS